MKIRPIDWIIHGFALLHAAVNVICSLSGIPDSLFLTALTMALTVIVCYRENLTVDITVMALILVNTIGFILGNVGAEVLVDLLPPPWQYAFTTFLVTEILGWSLYLFAHRIFPYGAAGYERNQSWYENAGWLVTAIALVFGVRLYIGHYYTGNLLLENSGAMMVLVLTTLLALLFMVNSAIRMRREVSAQRTRRHQAEFSYMTLKHQVNPHFLFNSLNVLDSLVQEGTKEEASDYIQKMATLYRYLMNQEGKRLVPISEEIEFSRTYRQLMEIRYPEGLVFDDFITDKPLQGYIVPCTLQLLVENAIKHNVISVQKPLVLTATTDGMSITISNNRIPKLTPVRSTGIGLQYIRNQYRDIAGLEIQIVETDDTFSVTIPLIRESEDFFVPLNRKHKQV